jgi:16S rRNA (cytosine1402-N4)-methyltransferase
VDGTIGGAGHAVGILKEIGDTGWLWGIDRDGAALKAAAERLAPFTGRFELRRGGFDRMAEWVSEEEADGVLLDLGVSSPQLDQAERGFSFQQEGPLDMRMDRDQPLTAADVVNATSVEELGRIFWKYGDEPRARRLARLIGEERQVRPLRTTKELAMLVERGAPRGGSRIHPATRVFQAIRMVVNDEMGQLERGLEAACRVLKPGGRLAVISFQSMEARCVKQFGAVKTRDYDFEGELDVPALRRPRPAAMRWVARRAIVAGEAELAVNPRARSAQLRVLEKV